MSNEEFSHSSFHGEESVDNARQNEKPEWSVYLDAARRRREQLASLNQRLALTFFNDVDCGHRAQRLQIVSYAHRSRTPLNGASSREGSDLQAHRDSATNPVEIEDLEAAVETETQNLRNSLKRYDMRIDTVRRAMNSLNQKNEELMEENAELRFSNADTQCELQQLKNVNEDLKEKLRTSKRTIITRSKEHLSQQNLITTLQNENRIIKGRLERHSRMVRTGLNDFISKSMDALKSGTKFKYNPENVFNNISVHGVEVAGCETGLQRTPLVHDSTVPKAQLDAVEDEMRWLSEELEHEKFRSKRKIDRLQERLDQMTQNLKKKGHELQRTNDELEAALGALQSLIRIGDEMQTDIDLYRFLLDREGSRQSDSCETSSRDSGYTSEAPEAAEPHILASVICERRDCVTSNIGSLEIANHDVRRGKFVVLKNTCDERLDITGWYLVQQCGTKKVCHRFRDPFVIEPKNKVIIWSADAVAAHQSPVNYVLHGTVLPWCDSGEVDLVTTIYDCQAKRVTTRTTRIRLQDPVSYVARKFLEESNQLANTSCSIS